MTVPRARTPRRREPRSARRRCCASPLITDNARAYRFSLRAVCVEHGIRQKFIKPHCPWQNGKVERLNRTLAIEWAYRQPFTSNQQCREALAPWLEHYNTRRRHSALGGHSSISRLTPNVLTGYS